MKKIILAVTLLSINSTVISQTTTGVSMGKDFGMISNLGKAQTGFESFQTYSSKDVKGSQFFSYTWCSGSVTTITNTIISKNYLFLYDKVGQNLYIKPKDSTLIVLADKSQISSFTLNTDKEHQFVKATLYNPSSHESFFEVLASGNYTLLKSLQTIFEKANPNDIERARSGDHSDAFVDHYKYFIFYNNSLQEIKLNENSLRKNIKNNDSKINLFLSSHQDDNINDDFLVSLFKELNS